VRYEAEFVLFLGAPLLDMSHWVTFCSWLFLIFLSY